MVKDSVILSLFLGAHLNPLLLSSSWVLSLRLTKCYMFSFVAINPLTSKIEKSILPSSYNIFPFKLVTRIWCWIKTTTSSWYVWVFSLPACWAMYRYCRERSDVNHLWVTVLKINNYWLLMQCIYCWKDTWIDDKIICLHWYKIVCVQYGTNNSLRRRS